MKKLSSLLFLQAVKFLQEGKLVYVFLYRLFNIVFFLSEKMKYLIIFALIFSMYSIGEITPLSYACKCRLVICTMEMKICNPGEYLKSDPCGCYCPYCAKCDCNAKFVPEPCKPYCPIPSK